MASSVAAGGFCSFPLAVTVIQILFLLRLPSEALPIVTGKADVMSDAVAVLGLGADESGPRVTLRLKFRKNRRTGSFLIRRCWCQVS